ncbi:MAG: type II toxin-antitoxin system Phd/YefM family antitoxin [Halochromatium sp.]|uniref:type II toxin-antitoxin system Phd/YefM family antitoxin n=1 Tax=Halochromatium sp. TaxID=2049430 RepID=UPI00397AD91B
MSDLIINLAQAKARLSELAECAEAGEPVVITRRGKAIVKLIGMQTERQAIDPSVLRALTSQQPAPRQDVDSQAMIRSLRDDTRY